MRVFCFCFTLFECRTTWPTSFTLLTDTYCRFIAVVARHTLYTFQGVLLIMAKQLYCANTLPNSKVSRENNKSKQLNLKERLKTLMKTIDKFTPNNHPLGSKVKNICIQYIYKRIVQVQYFWFAKTLFGQIYNADADSLTVLQLLFNDEQAMSSGSSSNCNNGDGKKWSFS